MWFCNRLDKGIEHFNQTVDVKLSITHFKRLDYVHYISQVPKYRMKIYLIIEYLLICFCYTYFLTRIKL